MCFRPPKGYFFKTENFKQKIIITVPKEWVDIWYDLLATQFTQHEFTFSLNQDRVWGAILVVFLFYFIFFGTK